MRCILLIVYFDYSAKRDQVQAGAPGPISRAQTYSGSSKIHERTNLRKRQAPTYRKSLLILKLCELCVRLTPGDRRSLFAFGESVILCSLRSHPRVYTRGSPKFFHYRLSFKNLRRAKRLRSRSPQISNL